MRIFQVDAFTDQPFRGNPACVCMLEAGRSNAWMQSLAVEMNLSETAFLLKQRDEFNLRWYTPKREVSLCGHATLAAAHILWEDKYLKPEETARFRTQSGLLIAQRNGGQIEMDFPARFTASSEENATLNIRSVIVTSRSDAHEYDFVSRYFASAVGINEDPVTGSAHCYLAPYWGTRLNRKSLVGFQASARTGIVGCEWNDDRVILRGRAVTIFKGELLV